ncbi:FHA domain-containing protein [Microbacterium soli]|uniref:FHA domain-containing protein n=1 Tax=Microbacterium soli TaxID=446075 RepID=A0ABP7N962_9MICO
MSERMQGYAPTTTHAEWGAGDPRLLISRDDQDRTVVHLTRDTVTIGSDGGCTVCLEGAAPLHATVVHDDRDEYVLTMHGPGLMNAYCPVDQHGARTETLRTGARFTVGEWMLVFSRAEFADHGRPYGGRQGGEGGHQSRQPERPDYPATGAIPTRLG